MRYSVQSSDIKDFYGSNYVENTLSNSFSNRTDEIDMGVLKMSIKEWKTPKLSAQLIETKAEKDVEIKGGIKDDMAILHFVCKGKSEVNRGATYPVKMQTNTNNLFCGMGENNSHVLKKSRTNEYFRVLLPCNYIFSMASQYPELFGTLSQLLEKQCPILKENNLSTSIEMNQVIDQIINCNAMGALAPMYLETKVHELLILQIQQVNKQDHTDCSCYIHYHDQINEARNIIENRFRNPPTISELAHEVNMSETVLKAGFKLFFGTTIFGYLFDYRMNFAQKLLADNSLTVAEIGYQTGYEHPSHFTTAFKRKFGVSPVVYRGRRA